MKIFAYSIVYDSGFAPCAVKNDSLTLACCKTNLRHKIGLLLEQNPDEDIYLIGLCGKQLAKRSSKQDSEYSPLFIAKVNSAVTTQEYFKYNNATQRPDQKYSYKNGKWFVKKGNPHHLEDIGELDVEKAKQERDLYYLPRKDSKPTDNYVLNSDEYIYYGKDILPRSKLSNYLETIASIREKAPRADLQPIPENGINSFMEFFKAELNRSINPDCTPLEEHFEKSVKKGECKKR